MGNLLFSPQGQIGRAAFHKGAVILLAINFFAWLAWYGGLGIGSMIALLSFGLIYNWACLFIKRFRDAGQPTWLFLPVLIGFAIISYVLGGVFSEVLVPEVTQEVLELQETMDPRNPDLDVVLPVYTRVFKAIAIPYAAAYLIAGSLLAFLINAKMRSASD